ncbi:hypothetical protein DFJ77DRAFT_460207 [Powellomyces hirtus]|nr:hypothetical protein DFJ77DRAFT_460207 [Powellomyces hirtus]
MPTTTALANPSYTAIPHPATGHLPSFTTFYPFYLGEHSNAICRRLHLIGTAGVTATLITAAVLKTPRALIYVPVIGYTFAWVGHFFFEKNKPATFTYPLWSLMADFKMFWEVLSMKRAF